MVTATSDHMTRRTGLKVYIYLIPSHQTAPSLHIASLLLPYLPPMYFVATNHKGLATYV